VVAVRAQGRVQGALVLARRQGWRGAATVNGTLSFDLAADELDNDGLLIVELAEARPPAWATGRISRSAALGLRINAIRVREGAAPAGPSGPAGLTGCDLAVLQPGAATGVRLEWAAVASAPPLPISPRNRLTRRKPARAVFKVSRAARRVAVRAVPARPGPVTDILAADLLTGAELPLRVLTRRADGLDLCLEAAGTGPVLLGAARSQPGLSYRATPGAPS
jgi:hypothetical protein